MGYFPIFIDLRKFNPLVVGGGEVAYRKVKTLVEFNATPKVIAPEVKRELKELIEQYKLEYEPRKYRKGDLEGFDLVFVATDDPTIDALIKEEADETGAIVNFADKPEMCNFIVPSIVRRGDLTISISTQGKAPFLARYIRELLEKKIPKNFKDFVDIAVYFRSKLMEKRISGKLKETIIDEFLSVKWIDIIEDDGMEYAKLLVNHLIDYYEHNH